jgi:hypothetical protein
LLKIDRKTLYNKIKNFQPINKVWGFFQK